jgi:hypothetical protein
MLYRGAFESNTDVWAGKKQSSSQEKLIIVFET